MEAPSPSGKAAEVETQPSHAQSSTLPTMQPANATSNVEDEEDELADDDDVVMTDVATGSSTVPSQLQPQFTPANLPRSAPRADGETNTAALAPGAAPNPAQSVPTSSVPTKKPHKPRAPKPEKSMMTSFKLRPPKEGTVNPVMSTATPSDSPVPGQLNVLAAAPTSEAAASKTSKSTPISKGQMKKRNRREEPNDPNVQVFYHDDAAAPATAVQKNEYPPEAASSLVPPVSNKPRAPSKQRTTKAEQPTEYFSIPVAEPLDLNGQPPKRWSTSYRTIQTISGATFGTRVWKSDGVKAEPLKQPPNWVLAPIYPTSATAQVGSAADKAASGTGTGAGTPAGAPTKRGRKSKAELAVLAAAAADGTITPVGKRTKAPKKPKKEKVGKSALVVDEPGSGAVTPSVQPEDVEMAPAS